jgi:tetratricopeptide (TPR) repeat protein
VGLFGLAVLAAVPAGADWRTCREGSSPDRIAACSALIDDPGLSMFERAEAHAMRGMAKVIAGDPGGALLDYDRAVELDAHAPLALNNRAWLLFRSGRLAEGADSVERALTADPGSPHALDTRAHIRQAQGDRGGARTDYLRAMNQGGATFVKMYQCGLNSQGLYDGPVTGLYTAELERALDQCLGNPGCDPLPDDEDCRDPMS